MNEINAITFQSQQLSYIFFIDKLILQYNKMNVKQLFNNLNETTHIDLSFHSCSVFSSAFTFRRSWSRAISVSSPRDSSLSLYKKVSKWRLATTRGRSDSTRMRQLVPRPSRFLHFLISYLVSVRHSFF